VTVHELLQRKRELERRLREVHNEMMPLCPMKSRFKELNSERKLITDELAGIVCELDRLRVACCSAPLPPFRPSGVRRQKRNGRRT
jgi:hypothetical protein